MPQRMPLGGARERIVVRAPGAAAIVGSVLLQNTGGEFYLSDLHVQPTYRHLGVGSRLVREAVQCARAQRVECVRLEARPSDGSISPSDLVQMYRKLGFSNSGVSARGTAFMKCLLTGPNPLPIHPAPGLPSQVWGRVQMKQAAASLPALRFNAGCVLRPVAHIAPPSAQRKPAFASARPNYGVVQRARRFNAITLSDMADEVNQARSGEADSRNTQAVTRSNSGTFTVFTQREYNVFDETLTNLEQQHNITLDNRVIGDNRRDDEGIHAEMLAISQWLSGAISKPKLMGVSQPVCGRCAAVLDIFNIQYCPVGGQMTKNWVHPIRHAFGHIDHIPHNSPAYTARNALGALPQKVTNNREYGW